MKRIFLLVFSCLFLATGCGKKELDFEAVYNNLKNEYKGFIEKCDFEGLYFYLIKKTEKNDIEHTYICARMYNRIERKCKIFRQRNSQNSGLGGCIFRFWIKIIRNFIKKCRND